MTSTRITGPFGSERVDVPDLPASQTPLMPGGVVPETTPVQATDSAFVGVQGFDEARAAREARAAAPDTTAFEGAVAAVKSWDTSRLLRRFSREEFEDDTPVNAHESLNNVDIALNDAERDYYIKNATGAKAAAYALQQIKDARSYAKVLGDHPIVGTLVSFADPLWLVVPPAVRLGRVSAAGRAVSAVTAGATGATVTALGEGPVSDKDIALSFAMNAAAGAVFYGRGKLDTDYPVARVDAALADAEKTVVGNVSPTITEKKAAEVAAKVEGGLGEKLMWNMHKTLSSYGPAGKRIADTLLDNNVNLSGTSVESHREAILSGLVEHQHAYEDLLRKAMAANGAGAMRMLNPFTSRQAYQVQQSIERDVQRELFRREQLTRQGVSIADPNVPPHITAMADSLDALHKRALAELKAAGVAGAEDLIERPGYMSRRWNSAMIEKTIAELERRGLTRDAAYSKITSVVALGIRRANPAMERDLADKVGSVIVDRAMRKGHFEDSAFNVPATGAKLAELRDMLKESGVAQKDADRILDALRVGTDEAGKVSFLKHRMDIDYRAMARVGDMDISIMDLIDSRVNTIVDQYTKKVATQAAFARAGLTKPSDVHSLRTELLKEVPYEQRQAASELFDGIVAHMRGDPAGAKVNENFRLYQAYGRAISLPYSGLWQMTEYATAMGEYGLIKTLKYAAQEFPGFRALLGGDTKTARTLATVLAGHSQASQRLRPFIARFEDGYEMDTGSALQLSAQTMTQAVPMVNGMKYVHHHQANMVGNLIMDRVAQAAKGDKAAREALAKYGIEAGVMDKLAVEIQKHGMDVDQWDDAMWAAVRPAFAKMMDASVLKARLGDVPAFALLDPVGKFIFSYRTFVLTAHNKLLAGGMERNGLAAVALVALYQWPLAMAAVQAQSVIKGEGTLSDEDMVKKTVGQMGIFGLFSEPMKWATGESNAFGAPGLIPADRAVKLFGAAVSGDAAGASSTALTMLPVLAAMPLMRNIANQIKE